MWVDVALVFVLILVNALLSGSEMALVTLREGQVHRLAETHERGKRLALLVSDPSRFLGTIQVGITLAGFMASAVAAVSLSEPLVKPLGALGNAAQPVAVVIVTVLLSYVTLVFGELAPKRIAMQKAQAWSLHAARPLDLIASLFRPLVWLLALSTAGVVRLFGLDPQAGKEVMSEEEIKDLLTGQESMPEQQRSIIEGALELDERRLWQVLVPRSEVVFVEAAEDVSTARDRLIDAGLSRAPVTGANEDDVIGFVHLRQLVAGSGPVSEQVRPALVLPDSVGVLQALGRMQQGRRQMALVVDEFGSIAGIVTLEDLLEEIVGEIYDEFDRDTGDVVRHPDGDLELPGSFPAHDLDDLGVDLEPGRHATVAGIMLEELGEIPPVGAAIDVRHWRMTALEVTPRAILRLKLTRVLDHPASGAPEAVPDATPDGPPTPDAAQPATQLGVPVPEPSPGDS